MTVLDCFVVGLPVAKGSLTPIVASRGGKKVRVLPSERQRRWQALISEHVSRLWTDAALDVPVSVSLVFVFPRPKNHFRRDGKTLRQNVPHYVQTRPDLDKLTRCVLDALQGVLLRDDMLVVQLMAAKCYAGEGERCGVRITVRRFTDGK